MNKKYILFTDTDTDITLEEANKIGYKLISMPYSIDDKEVFPYEDFSQFNAHEYYELLRKGTMPKTSALSPTKYSEYFEPYLKQGYDILYVHFSKAMSGTFNALNLALEELKEKYPNNNVYLIDTKGITIGSYNIVMEIGDLYKEGKSIKEIMDWADVNVDKFATFFFASDLKFFRRSGRVKALTAIMGNLIHIHPIITIGSDGVMKSLSTAKGQKQTLNKILEYVDLLNEDINKHRVIIAHTDAIDIAKELGNKLVEKYGELNICYVDCNPTAGAHCGPDGVGINFYAKRRDL